jgi:NAD(P)-dependent dehydrogenase (short-subunit alcohol dehydrogenase family)
MSLLLNGKTVIVTGAGRGIGQATALLLAREGARVVLAGRTAASLEETAAAIQGPAGQAVCVVTDVSRSQDCQALVQRVVRDFGRLDCAINNAAVDGPQALTVDYPEESYDEVMAINAKGVWNCMRFQIAAMMKSGGGAIVNISSATTQPTVPNMSAYVASKYAVIGLTKSAAIEYARHNIRVNVLIPGIVETPTVKRIFETYPQMRPALLAQVANGRFAAPEEVAEAAAWLCSERSSYVVGAGLLVDGGFSLI